MVDFSANLPDIKWLALSALKFFYIKTPKTLPQKSETHIVGEFDLQYFFTLMIN